MYCGFLWGNPLSRYDRQFDSARGLCASMPFPGLRYHPRMPDADDKLTPADPREVVTALSLGLTSGRQLARHSPPPVRAPKGGRWQARPGYRIYFVREGNGALPENWLLLRHEPIVWSVGLLRLIARDILLMQRSQLILGGLGSYSFRPIAPTSIQSRWLLQS